MTLWRHVPARSSGDGRHVAGIAMPHGFRSVRQVLQLIFALLGISLMAATATAMVTVINPAPIIAAREAARLQDGFTALQTGYQNYTDATHALPSSLGDFTPSYAFLPPAPKGAGWSLGLDSSGLQYVCVSGSLTSVQLQAVQMLSREFSPQAYYIGNACGSRTAPSGGMVAAYLLVRPGANFGASP